MKKVNINITYELLKKYKNNLFAYEFVSDEEADILYNTVLNLISRHNTLCFIEKAFQENKYAKQYFEEAEQEILNSGNQSLAAMYSIAIENMSNFIEEVELVTEEENKQLKERYNE